MRDGWSQIQLGEVVALDIDKVPVAADEIYSIAGVYSFARGLFHRDPIKGSETSYPVLHRLQEGQLVLSRLKGWEGAIAPVTADFDGCCLSPEFPTFRPSDAITIDYLTVVTQQPFFWESLRQRAVGVGGRKSRVKAEVFLQTRILLPPVEEQLRIVSLITRVDAHQASAGRVAAAAAAARRTMAAEILEGIESRQRLGDVVEVTIGRQRSPSYAVGEHMTPYLRAANVKAGHLNLDDVKLMNFVATDRAKFGLAAGDVLVTEGCGSLDQLGASAVYCGEIEGDVCFQNTLLRLRAKPAVTTPGYVEVLARWAFDSGLFASVAKGTNIYHLGTKRAEALQVPVPTVQEQECISALLYTADAAAKAAAKVERHARASRQAVVSSLLSGAHGIPASYDALLEGAGSDKIEAA